MGSKVPRFNRLIPQIRTGVTDTYNVEMIASVARAGSLAVLLPGATLERCGRPWLNTRDGDREHFDV